MQVRPIADQRIKIVFIDTNEYLALLKAIQENFHENKFTREFAERLEDALQGSFDAQDSSVDGHPSSVIENKQIDAVFVLLCFASVKMTEKNSMQTSDKLKRENEILKLTIAKLSAM